MGLAADFKKWAAAHAPDALEAGSARADIVVLDSMCTLHAFSPREEDARPKLDQLADRLWSTAAACCNEGATVVICFDRQSSTTRYKLKTQAKRHRSERVWPEQEVDALIARRDLPSGSDWPDFLSHRHLRARAVEALACEVLEIFKRSASCRGVVRMIVHNGRASGPAQVADQHGGVEDVSEDAPSMGEADIAIPLWTRRLVAERPGASAAILTVDTDLVPIMLSHGGENCSVLLTHAQQHHRQCIHTAVLAACVRRLYGLTHVEFVVVCILKGTDFCGPLVRGIPSWHDTLRWAGEHLRSSAGRPIVRADGSLDTAQLLRLASAVVMHKPKASVNPPNAAQREALEFNVRYWTELRET